MSKFSLEVLNRVVFPHFRSKDPDVIIGAVYGEDVALTRVGEDVLVSHVDPIVGAVNNIGWLAVHVACNDVATSGAPPRWIQLLVLVPHKEDEDLLEKIMSDVVQAAEEIDVSIIGGHSGYSAALSRPLVAVTALGTLRGQKPVLTRGAYPGDHILITKGIGLEGTAILANDFTHAALNLGLTREELEQAKQLMKQVSVIHEAICLAKSGATSMHDVTRGGLLETLLEIAALSDVGLKVEDDRIPMPSIVERFSEAFNFDPLKMISSGTLVATIPPSYLKAAKQGLDQRAIPFADIGTVVTGSGVDIVRGTEVQHYSDSHPEEDELARMWVIHPADEDE